MNRPIDKRSNHLLAALPDAEWMRWEPKLEIVDLKLGQVLYESGGNMSYAYFPIDSIISLLFVLENGSSAEIADRISTRVRSSVAFCSSFPR